MQKKYEHIKKLGQGGNGIVWEVVTESKEKAAKKVLKRVNDNRAYSRFKDEIEVVSKNKHEGIIEILDAFLPDELNVNAKPYYIMPLGIPLKDYLETIGLDETFRIVLRIIDTVEFLHKQDITHRDLKIENLLIVSNEPKISDFGLANFPKQKRVSNLNEKIGPAFTIAPEMRRISSVAEYKRADVYSLAKTIWVILSKQWLSFDGQYTGLGSISLKNHIDLMIHKMTIAGETYYFSLVILEQLLTESTHNDPEKRPDISVFKERFKFWLESNSNFELRNNIEWADAINKIFPISVPESSYWSNANDIHHVLKKIFSEYDQLNHCFFPRSGGMDLESVRIITVENIDYLLINEWYLVRPDSLSFESMNSYEWSYFRLQIMESKPFYNSRVYMGEETLYLDENNTIHEKEDKSRVRVDFFLSGSFLIVQKASNINRLKGELDHYSGLHNKMSNAEYKRLVQKMIEHFKK